MYWTFTLLTAVTVPPAFFWACGRIERMADRDRKPWAPPVVREVYDPRITWAVQAVGPEQPLPPLRCFDGQLIR